MEQCCTHGMVTGPSTPPGKLRTLSRWFAAWKMQKTQSPSSDGEGWFPVTEVHGVSQPRLVGAT
jgi:hypothetical protein